MQESAQKLCQLAEEYIKEQYAPVGNRAYVWEKWTDELDDTTAHAVSGEAPPGDCDDYSWSEVTELKIISSELEERNDDKGEYTVLVTASMIVASGSADDDEEEDDDELEATEHDIWVYIERYPDGELEVVDAEE
ncbi:hypothetical protein BV372_17350 [Nostoc sp. T09]|uniref:hypothetical protein n=1 Tax=Nostoc sp. T09 TaxID=1932621 RepID=UPI000A3AE0AF|nr:hypothetical protein [Nostoc sp. T09]OUL33112.1 hypothetical protein BV372_17350 [Nostoc sp. T09]